MQPVTLGYLAFSRQPSTRRSDGDTLSVALSPPRFQGTSPQYMADPLDRLHCMLSSYKTVRWVLSGYLGNAMPDRIKDSHEKLLSVLSSPVDPLHREEMRQQLIQDYWLQRSQDKSESQIMAEYQRLLKLAEDNHPQEGRLETLGFMQTLKTFYDDDRQEITDCVNNLLLQRLPKHLRQIDTLGDPPVTPMLLVEALDTVSETLLCDSALHHGTALMKPDGEIRQDTDALHTAADLSEEMALSLKISPQTAHNLLRWIVQAAAYEPNLLGGFTARPTPQGDVLLIPESTTEPQHSSLRARWSQPDPS